MFDIKLHIQINALYFTKLNYFMCVDWLIDWCLTFNKQFFSYIQDENI